MISAHQSQRSNDCHTPVTQALTKQPFSWDFASMLKHGVMAKNWQFGFKRMVAEEGLEPPTRGL